MSGTTVGSRRLLADFLRSRLAPVADHGIHFGGGFLRADSGPLGLGLLVLHYGKGVPMRGIPFERRLESCSSDG